MVRKASVPHFRPCGRTAADPSIGRPTALRSSKRVTMGSRAAHQVACFSLIVEALDLAKFAIESQRAIHTPGCCCA